MDAPMSDQFLTSSTDATRRKFLGGAAVVLHSFAQSAFAQSDTVTRLIVPFTAGASNDLLARMFAETIARTSGKPWIVENKAGAGSLLGADFVAKSKPDGTTLLLCATASMGVLPAIRKTMSYAVDKDFTFFARIASSPFALAINSQVPVANFSEFVRLAKAKPGALRIGSTGIGSLDFMGASLLQSQLGLDLNIIPYKGMAPVLNDLRAGHIDASIVSPATIDTFVKQGSVKVLAVFDKQRSSLLPDVPSTAELNFPKLMVLNWWGISGPAHLPAEIKATLLKNISQSLADPRFLESMKTKGFEPAVLLGAHFERFVLDDLKAWRAIAKQSNIQLES
jgi:tripartite-type tricarboxylate transporter receptor subunit TctC